MKPAQFDPESLSDGSGIPTPAVSIILPTHDRVRFLPEAVESARTQTFGDWEMIVVDDGSTDGTAEYLAEAAADPRIRVITLPRAGRIARLRNLAVAQARGAYIAFLDSDDYWHPEKLAKQLAALGATPGARWCFNTSVGVAEDRQPLAMDGPRPRPPRSGWILEPLLEHQTGITVPAVMVERCLFDQVGGFDEAFKLGEDHDLWLRLAAAAPAAGVDEELTFVRVHPRQTTRLSPVPSAAAMVAVYEKCRRSTRSPTLRRICRKNQAAYAMYTALGWYARRRPARFLANLLLSLRYDPTGAAVWRMLSGPAARRLRALVRRNAGGGSEA